MLETIILSSLHKVYPQNCPQTPLTALSGMRNEPLSFQLAYKLEDGSEKHTTPIYPRIETDLDLNLYSVGYVPVVHTHWGGPREPQPGLIGDMLLPKAVNPELEHKGYPWKTLYFEKGEKITLNAANDAWQALWFTVNENGKSIAPGKYTVRIALYESYDGEKIGENEIEITILDAELPKQKLKYTNWFHCDCLADFYNVEIFSDSFFEIMRAQVACAVKNGMNMILTPFFTPPLDTPVDDERMTAQLVKVNVVNDEYSFDFSLLKKFIDICREEGMEYFEHSHLFTQWGSKAAPKVIACVDGVEKRIFGWDTPATGDEYTAFLDAYLPAVKKFLAGEKLSDKILFHVSDEPTEDNAEQYRKAKAVVSKHLKGYLCGDALSHYLFYEEGLVETPIVATHNIDEFLGRCGIRGDGLLQPADEFRHGSLGEGSGICQVAGHLLADEGDVLLVVHVCAGGADVRIIICPGDFPVITCHFDLCPGLFQGLVVADGHFPALFKSEDLLSHCACGQHQGCDEG